MGSFVPSVLARTIETMKEVTGLDLVDVMKASTYDAKVNRNVTVQGDPQGAVKTAMNEEA
jgi:flotillin